MPRRYLRSLHISFHRRHSKIFVDHRPLTKRFVLLQNLLEQIFDVIFLGERFFSDRLIFNRFSCLLFIFSSLIPLTLANKFRTTTASNVDFSFDNKSSFIFPFNLSSSSTLLWNVGCCLRFNQKMCDAQNSSSYKLTTVDSSNETLTETLLFDYLGQPIDRYRSLRTDSSSSTLDFLNNQTLFCQRYDTFRYLSSNHLAIFTYCVVIIGIIFNSCVFLVLILGSMRRSTSFTLFLALTCFDLLSLASSLFALLFRTVMTYLKTSAPFCKMFGIFFLYFRQCSSTTLLLIAIERCIVIKYPFCRHIFNRFRLPFLAAVMFIYVVPIPFDFIFYTSGSLHCEAFDTPHAHRYQIFRGFFTVFSYAMIPFVGISISNLLIIMELKNSRKRFMTTDENGTMRRFSSKSVEK